MSDHQIVFLSRIPREVFAAVFLVGALLVWWMYARVSAKVNPRVRWVLIGLRWAFLAILILILAVPAIETPRSKSGELFTAVVVDGSLEELHFVVLFGRGGRLSGALGFSRPRALMAYRPFIERAASFEEALKFKLS